MDDIHSRMELSVSLFILPGHDQESDNRRIKHLSQTGNIRYASDRDTIKLVPGKAQPVLDEVFQFSPDWRPSMSDKDVRPYLLRTPRTPLLACEMRTSLPC